MTSKLEEMEQLIKHRPMRRLFLKLVERSLKKDLTPSQHAVVGFIADRTLRFNKLWERITVHQICHGIRTRDGLWIHRGIRISERQAQRVLEQLLNGNVILRKPIRATGQTTYQYAINLECELFRAGDMMDFNTYEDQFDPDHTDPGLTEDQRNLLREDQLH